MKNYSEDIKNLGGRTANTAEEDKLRREEEFENLIRDYKEQFQDRFNREFARRFRNMKEQEEELMAIRRALRPVLEFYGTDNVNEAVNRFLNDNETVTRRKAEEYPVDAGRYSGWMAEASETAKKYPGFDFAKEWETPHFRAGMNSGIPMEALYRGLHFDELSKAIAEAASKATVENIRSGNGRINEVGSEGSASVRAKKKVNELTDTEIDEYLERIRRGERISFSE